LISRSVLPSARRRSLCTRAWQDRRDAGEAGERGFVAEAPGMGPRAQDGGGDDRADALLVEQVGPPRLDDRHDGLVVLGGFGLDCLDPPTEIA
jgi:hypothetical protein